MSTSEAEPALLRLSKVSARYGATPVLSDINLQVPPGGTLAILGSNGAGKTTLLRVISGLRPPHSGEIVFGGRSLVGCPPHEVVRRGIAHVPEGRRMFPYLSTRTNLRLGAYVRADRAAAEAEIEAALERWTVVGRRRNAPAGTLSGGEQQLVAILRGVMAAPRLLLLDEPSLGLAPALVGEIYRVLATLARERNIAVLLVEQNAARALEFAQQACVLVAGRLVFAGPAHSITSEEVSRMYFGQGTAGEGAEGQGMGGHG